VKQSLGILKKLEAENKYCVLDMRYEKTRMTRIKPAAGSQGQRIK